jgi:hypothetical protein
MREGTIISGTLRPQDTLPAFFGALSDGMKEQFRKGTFAEEIAEMEKGILDYDSAIVWDLIEAITDALNEEADEGFYFGTIEGDGSDFGFWRIWNDD